MSAAPIAKVLVVDDTATMRQSFGRFLTTSGIQASFAVDGAEGLRVARAERPDAIVCDLDMPNMDGPMLCAALRADDATRRMPIVVVTGAGGEQVRAALDAGCDAVLPKPCSRDLLIATVRDLLGLPEEARAAGPTSPPPPGGRP